MLIWFQCWEKLKKIVFSQVGLIRLDFLKDANQKLKEQKGKINQKFAKSNREAKYQAETLISWVSQSVAPGSWGKRFPTQHMISYVGMIAHARKSTFFHEHLIYRRGYIPSQRMFNKFSLLFLKKSEKHGTNRERTQLFNQCLDRNHQRTCSSSLLFQESP